MIYDNFSRQILLAATGAIFVGFAIWAATNPKSLATSLGYTLTSKNAISEFHAIYVGVFMAQAGLCALACTRVADAAIGNVVAVFLLGQPFGRMIAAVRGGWPAGFLLVLFAMELVGGGIILWVQPSP